MEKDILTFLNEYGMMFIFVMIFMEYLSLPMPGGIVFPAVGFWAKLTGRSLLLIIVLSVLAGLLGSIILYGIGRYGGKPLAEKLYKRFPKTAKKIIYYEEKMQDNADKTVFIARIIPAIRTLIGFPAGFIKMNVGKYMLYSALGITVWNGVLILGGSLLTVFVA